jgi:hypothetical protein
VLGFGMHAVSIVFLMALSHEPVPYRFVPWVSLCVSREGF